MVDPHYAAEERVENVVNGFDLGLSFISLNGKRPKCNGWQSRPRATYDEAIDMAANGNVGIRTGSASGNVIVVDDDTGGDGLASLGIAELKTATVLTSKGVHKYVRVPKGTVIRNSRSKIAAGVDIRGEDGQAVFPGSIHPDSGDMYDWAPGLSLEDVGIADAPSELLERLADAASQEPEFIADEEAFEAFEDLPSETKCRLRSWALARVEGRCETLREMSDGEGRNEEFFKATAEACEFRNTGLLADGQVEMVREAYASHGDVPDSKVESTYQSALRKTQGKGKDPIALLEWLDRDEGHFGPFSDASPTATRRAEFPVDALPRQLREPAEAVAKQLQVDPAMVALQMISLIAATTLGVVRVKVTKSWSVLVTLWIVVLAETGERKSAVASWVHRALKQWLRDQSERYRLKARIIRDKIEMIELRMQTIKRESAKAGSHSTDREGPAEEIAKLNKDKQAEEASIPRDPDWLFQDTTMEAMASRAERTHGRGYIHDTEGGFLAYISGKRFGSGSNPAVDFALKGREGETFVVDRKNNERGTLRIDAVYVVMSLIVQPAAFAQALDSEMLKGVGFMARLLVAHVERASKRRLQSDGVPGRIQQEYDSMIFGLLDALQGSAGEELDLALTPEAFAYFESHVYDVVEREMDDDGRYAHARDVANRFPATVVQLAAVFHLAARGPKSASIELDTIKNAHRVGLWLLDATLAVLCPDGARDSVAEFAERFIKRAESGRLVRSKVHPAFCAAFPEHSGIDNRTLWKRLRPLLGLEGVKPEGRDPYYLGFELLSGEGGAS